MIDMRKMHRATGAALFVLLMAHGWAQRAPHSSYLPGPVSAEPASAEPASTAAAAAGPSADLASMDLEKLMDIKVTTASLFSDRLSQAPSIMSVVTRDELRRFRGLTLNEVLQTVPGLTGSTQYFVDRSMVAARGDQTKTDGGHILFMINGRPTREVMEGGIISDLLESFPVEILDRIEIIKGPGSVLYGSNAFSAVVNLITRKADGTGVTVKGTGGVGAAMDSSANLTLERGHLNAVGAVQLHQLPDWNLTYLVPPSQQNLSFAPAVPPVEAVDLKDRGFGAYLGANWRGLRFMSSFTEWQSTGFIEGTVSGTRLSRDFGNLGYDRKVRPYWDTSLDLTFTRTTFKEPPFPYVTRDSDESLAEWTNLFTLGARDRLSAGGSLNRIEGQEWFTATTPITVDAQGRRLGGAFYAQLDHQLLDRVKLIGGFQTNRIGSIPLHFDPRGGAVWTPKPWASFKALYGQAFRAPSLDENLLNNPGLGGNPNLKPEEVATLDLGLYLEGRKAQFGIDYFHSKFTDNIVNLPGPTRAVYFNQGQLTFNGVEVAGKYYLSRDVFLQGSTLWQTNVDGNGTANVSPVPNLGFKGGVSYAGGHGLTAGLFDVSDGPLTGYSSVNPLLSWRNNLNGNLRWEPAHVHLFGGGMALVAHGNDLANQAIWLPSGFSSVDTVPVQQGRTVFAGLEYALPGK
jgi:outer membrane receptor protein involved in Fe transport